MKVRDQVYQQRNNGTTDSSLGKFSRLQQREGKQSSPPQPGLGKAPAEFSLLRAEEMAEEELLDVQKMLSLGQGKSRRSAFGMKELRDRAELRGDCRSLERGGASLGVLQPWEQDGSVQGALQPCPGGSGSSSLCHPFPALPSPEDEEPW